MNPAILDDVESFRLKLEQAEKLTPELRREGDLLYAVLTTAIEEHHAFVQSLERIQKGYNKETNELLVTKNFLNQIMKGKT